MPRPTMATLLSRLRVLIGDPAGGSQVFSDDDLQAFLDENRIPLLNVEMTSEPWITGAGVRQYRNFYSPFGALEDGYIVYTFQDDEIDLTPWTVEPLIGFFQADVDQLDDIPLYIRGNAYDLKAAAADALEAWLAKVKFEYDFASGGESHKRSQKWQAMEALAQKYRGESSGSGDSGGVSSLVMERSDTL